VKETSRAQARAQHVQRFVSRMVSTEVGRQQPLPSTLWEVRQLSHDGYAWTSCLIIYLHTCLCDSVTLRFHTYHQCGAHCGFDALFDMVMHVMRSSHACGAVNLFVANPLHAFGYMYMAGFVHVQSYRYLVSPFGSFPDFSQNVNRLA